MISLGEEKLLGIAVLIQCSFFFKEWSDTYEEFPNSSKKFHI